MKCKTVKQNCVGDTLLIFSVCSFNVYFNAMSTKTKNSTTTIKYYNKWIYFEIHECFSYAESILQCFT